MKPISKFLCRCAGADINVISRYPSEVSRYNSIGATIIFTGFFATLSGGYALYKVFDDLFIASVLGIIWGLMIFNLDRYIVMSMKKKDSFWNEFLTALPRIILAIIISIVVAKPLEVRIFSDMIMGEIANSETDKMIADREKSEEIFKTKNAEDVVVGLTKEVEATKEKRNQDSEEVKKLKREKKDLNNNLLQKIQQRRAAQIKISDFFRRYTYKDSVNGELVEKIATRKQHLPSGAWEKIRNIVYKRDGLKKEIEKLNEAKQKLDDAISDGTARYIREVDNKVNKLERKEREADSIKTLTKKNYAALIRRLDSINNIAYSDNLVTQIKALGSLTKYREPVLDTEGNVIEEPDNTMYWMNWMIILLFIVIEIAPIFVKLISSKGQYEAAAESKEKIKKSNLESQSKMKEVEDESNEEATVLVSTKKSNVIHNIMNAWESEITKNIKNYKDNKDFEDALKEVLKFRGVEK
jgi:hypothetical protein